MVALTGLVLPAAAPAAKKLSIGKASRATEKLAKRDCRRDSDCEQAEAGNCRRLARRRVSCIASTIGIDRKGDFRCDRLVIVRLRTSGGLKRAAGRPSCYRT